VKDRSGAKVLFWIVVAAFALVALVMMTNEPERRPVLPARNAPPPDSASWTEDCPEGMVRIGNQFCVDRYEYPNRAGELPRRGVRSYEAREACRAEGKRLCTGDEWAAACAGSPRRSFAMTKSHDTRACRWSGDGPSESGSHPDCHGVAPVFDMVGNVWEWTDEPGGSLAVSGVARGGSWRSIHSDADCGFRYPFIKGQEFFMEEFGFRCCL